MNKYTIIILLFVFGAGISTSVAQDHKVAFTNVELLLAYLPESKEIEQKLNLYEKKLVEGVEIKQKYYQSELSVYMEKEQNNRWLNQEEKNQYEKKLQSLQQEIQLAAEKAELSLLKKREALLNPIMVKMQNAIDAVATEKGYDYVLNQALGGGVPSILVGKESNDITEFIAVKLGISID